MESATLKTQLEERRVKHRELEQQLQSTRGEEQLVGMAQIGRVETQILEILDDLVRNVELSDQEGLDTSEFVAVLGDQLTRTSEYLYDFIGRLQRYLLDLSRTRHETPLEDLLSLEQRLAGHKALIENYYQILLEHGDRSFDRGFW